MLSCLDVTPETAAGSLLWAWRGRHPKGDRLKKGIQRAEKTPITRHLKALDLGMLLMGTNASSHFWGHFWVPGFVICSRKHLNKYKTAFSSVQFCSVAQSCPTLCDSMDCSTPGLPVHHQLPKLTQTHVHWVGDAIQPCHPLSSPSPPAFNLSQHQGLLQWVSSSHQMAKILEFQLQHQSFQWTARTDFL